MNNFFKFLSIAFCTILILIACGESTETSNKASSKNNPSSKVLTDEETRQEAEAVGDMTAKFALSAESETIIFDRTIEILCHNAIEQLKSAGFTFDEGVYRAAYQKGFYNIVNLSGRKILEFDSEKNNPAYAKEIKSIEVLAQKAGYKFK